MVERDYAAAYYSHPQGLIPVADPAEGVQVVETLHHLHDGDFLFVAPGDDTEDGENET